MIDDTLTIVSIDDNETNLILIESYCEELGVLVTSFSNPLKALTFVLQEKVDMIVIDYMMPDLNGIEFVREFRKFHKHIPIVMVTAVGDDNNLHLEALQAGVNDFLLKPVNSILFTARVKNLLDLRQAHLMLEDRAKLLEHEVKLATQEIVKGEFETLYTLGKTAEYKDPETGAHVARVAHYSKMLADGYGLEEELQDIIFHSSPFHDIGKVGIPDNILLKPGRLDVDEFDVMKNHAAIGYEILHNSNSKYLKVGGIIALSHHEKYDGSGYPSGLVGEDIPIEGRIVAIADVFDALTSKRPYKKAWTFESAMDFLKENSGSHFDPALVTIFVDNIKTVESIYNKHQEVDTIV